MGKDRLSGSKEIQNIPERTVEAIEAIEAVVAVETVEA